MNHMYTLFTFNATFPIQANLSSESMKKYILNNLHLAEDLHTHRQDFRSKNDLQAIFDLLKKECTVEYLNDDKMRVWWMAMKEAEDAKGLPMVIYNHIDAYYPPTYEHGGINYEEL